MSASNLLKTFYKGHLPEIWKNLSFKFVEDLFFYLESTKNVEKFQLQIY